MKTSQLLIVGIAGVIAIVCLELLKLALKDSIDDFALLWTILALSTSTIYVACFKMANFLDREYFWRLRKRNLSGKWTGDLKNVDDKSSRSCEVMITQDRDSILLNAVNYRDDPNQPYSHWRSSSVLLQDDHLIFLFEVESIADQFHFKRGVMRIELNSSDKAQLHGIYFDSAPSNAAGPIVLNKQ